MTRRIPTRGFNNIFKKEYSVLNLKDLNRFEAGATVNLEVLKELGMVRKNSLKLKILGDGDFSKRLVVYASQFSKSAKEKIEAAGGKAEVV